MGARKCISRRWKSLAMSRFGAQESAERDEACDSNEETVQSSAEVRSPMREEQAFEGFKVKEAGLSRACARAPEGRGGEESVALEVKGAMPWRPTERRGQRKEREDKGAEAIEPKVGLRHKGGGPGAGGRMQLAECEGA